MHHLETLTITLNLPDTCLPHALAMWNVGEEEDGLATSLPPTGKAPTDHEVEEGLRLMKEENTRREELFKSIIDTLCGHLESGKLHWRQYNAGFAFLATLTRHDMRLSSRAVKIMVGNLVHDNITVRKVAIHNMAGVLRQHKRKHPMVEREVERGNLVVGDRPDNAWLQYKQEHWPRTKEEWNSPNFVHKTHFGYYCWPEKMMVYAGEEHQPRCLTGQNNAIN